MRTSRRTTQLLRHLASKQKNVIFETQNRYSHQQGVNFVGNSSKAFENPHTAFPVAAVFGASGFLGRYITASLAEMGYQVIVPHRFSDYSVMGHRVMGDIGQIVTMRFSPEKYDTVYDICARSNVVVNALGRDINKLFDKNMEHSNVFCTEQIAKACREAAVDRLIHVSCMGADEKHPSKLLRQKARGEQIVRDQFPQATIVRPAPTYGTEDHFLNWIAKCLRILPGVPLFNAGSAKTQPVYCVDVGDAIANSISVTETIGKVVELAGPETFTYNELVDVVAKLIGEPATRMHAPAIAGKLFGVFNEYTWRPTFTADFVTRMQYDTLETKNDANVLKFADVGVRPQQVNIAAREFLGKWRRNPNYFLDVNYKGK